MIERKIPILISVNHAFSGEIFGEDSRFLRSKIFYPTLILVLEILLLRIIHDDNVTKIKLTHPTHRNEDGGSVNISVIQCFDDDMTCVIEETEKSLLMTKSIFESFAALSGLEINEGKTKVIRIGDQLDNKTPLPNKV